MTFGTDDSVKFSFPTCHFHFFTWCLHTVYIMRIAFIPKYLQTFSLICSHVYSVEVSPIYLRTECVNEKIGWFQWMVVRLMVCI